MKKNEKYNDLEVVTIQCGARYHDIFIRPQSSDRFVLGQIFFDKSYDISKLKRFDDLRRFYFNILDSGKKPFVIDAGANIGASSLYFSLMMPQSIVIAIEPDDDNYLLLKKNTQQRSITSINAALTSDGHNSKLIDIGNSEWGFVTSPNEIGDEDAPTNNMIRGTTVPEILMDHLDCVPFLVKVDIEGAEAEVFSGNADWVKAIPLIIIEPHDWLFPNSGGMVNFFRELTSINFDIEVNGENVFIINNDPKVWNV